MGVLGARFGGRFLRRTLASLSSLRGELQAGDAAWHYHCTNHSKMWPLSSSAAEEVAEKAALISIDVPADSKWVLLAQALCRPDN